MSSPDTTARTVNLHGVTVPTLLYGTAWKEDDTQGLVKLALEAGFRGIDTANQRKHYHEAGVGAALAEVDLERDDLFLQTKFTFQGGQDHRLPYDPSASLTEQVRQSFASSLEHLGLHPDTGVIDSYVLHGPSTGRGWTDDDRETWRAMEQLHEAGRVRLLGVSNVSRDQLLRLLDEARVPPVFVQNRCYARLGWDAPVRGVCADHGIVYQGFSLLTANARELQHPELLEIAARHDLTPAQTVFRAAQHMGMIPLTGTTDVEHMQQDLAIYDVTLDARELHTIETLGVRR